MTVEDGVKNAALDALSGLIDGGGGDGYLHFLTAAAAEVAKCPFAADSFPGAAAGSMTANAIDSDTNCTAGTIASCKIYDFADVLLATLTVGVGTGDMQLSSLTVGLGDTLAVSSLTITHA